MKTLTNINFTPVNNAIISKNIFIIKTLEKNNKFSTNAILFSQKDVNNLINDDIRLTPENEAILRKDLDKLSKIIEVSDIHEVEESMSRLDKYVQEHPDDMLTYDEAFPKLAAKITTGSDFNQGITNSINNSADSAIFKILNSISTELKKCSGNSDCLKNLKLTELIQKVISMNSENKTEEIGKIVQNELESQGILKKIGDITLNDIYQKYKNLDEKLLIHINPNYKEIGFSMVSYGLLINRYNKYVHNRPIPTNLTSEDLRVVKTTRTIARY